jgi:hypothetical protein
MTAYRISLAGRLDCPRVFCAQAPLESSICISKYFERELVPKVDWNTLPLEDQVEYGLDKLAHHFVRMRPAKVKKWATRVAHAVFILHPELREEGSLDRYFVAKIARKLGLRGSEVTGFVDAAYKNGNACHYIAEGYANGVIREYPRRSL